MNYGSIYGRKIILFFGLIVMLFIPNFCLAQNNEKPKIKQGDSPAKAIDEKRIPIDKWNGFEVWKGRLLFKSRKQLSEQEVKNLETGLKSDIELIDSTNIYLIQSLDSNTKTEDLRQRLGDVLEENSYFGNLKSDVKIEPDYIIQAEPDLPPVPPAPCPLAMAEDPRWGLDKIQALQALEEIMALGGEETIVAVLDHGIAEHPALDIFAHPDLDINLWKAPEPFTISTEKFKNVTCPKGTRGVNFTAGNVEDVCKPGDDNNKSHGTKVAGVIGANGKVRGVNKNATLLPIKVLIKDPNLDFQGALSTTIRAWNFIIGINEKFSKLEKKQNPIIIVNHSYGFQGNPDDISLLRERIQLADKEGLLLIASAGNNRLDIDEKGLDTHYPASINEPNVIAVSATDPKDKILCASNFGRHTVDVAAPGMAYSTSRNGNYETFSLTSAAAAFVSGAASLVLSACPNLTNKEIKTYLEDSAFDNHGKLKESVINGRIDVFKAVKRCKEKEKFSFDNIFFRFNHNKLHSDSLFF